jgi:hypothetical protein
LRNAPVDFHAPPGVQADSVCRRSKAVTAVHVDFRRPSRTRNSAHMRPVLPQ